MASMNKCLEVLTSLRMNDRIDTIEFNAIVNFIEDVWDIDHKTFVDKYNRYTVKHNLVATEDE